MFYAASMAAIALATVNGSLASAADDWESGPRRPIEISPVEGVIEPLWLTRVQSLCRGTAASSRGCDFLAFHGNPGWRDRLADGGVALRQGSETMRTFATPDKAAFSAKHAFTTDGKLLFVTTRGTTPVAAGAFDTTWSQGSELHLSGDGFVPWTAESGVDN